MSRVSVIIPTCNRPYLLERAIRSVLAQSHSDFELIVVDDGSTVATQEVVSRFADMRIVYLNQKREGRSAARNRGITAAHGDYISFLDDDDRYLPEKLSLQHDFLEQNARIGLVASGARLIDERGRTIPSIPPWTNPDELNLTACLISNRFHTCAVMIRRTALEGWDLWFEKGLDYAEDAAFYIRLAQRGVRMVWLPAIVAEYWLDGGRGAGDSVAYLFSFQKFTDGILREINAPNWLKESRSRIEAERDLLAALRVCGFGTNWLTQMWLKQAKTKQPGWFAGGKLRALEIIERYLKKQAIEISPEYWVELIASIPADAGEIREGITRLKAELTSSLGREKASDCADIRNKGSRE